LKKIGIFGGTFDPVHIAHLRTAEEFAEILKLDRVLMMVSAIPPHRESPLASALDRLKMLELAVYDNPVLAASDLEVKRDGPSFTLETVRKVRSESGGSIPYLALGVDAFFEIATWHKPADVMAEAHIVVLTRPGFEVDLVSPVSRELYDRYQNREGLLVHESGATLRVIQVTSMDLSSSTIRSLITKGRSIRYLVPQPVFKYIQQNDIYKFEQDREEG
jgi:nicotinate-nucleotide adenylyltransferase